MKYCKLFCRKDDVRLESVRTLRGAAGESDSGEKGEGSGGRLPDFVSMLSFVKEKAALREKSPHKYTVGNVVMPFNPLAYTEVALRSS
jgi:hypothetical protein